MTWLATIAGLIFKAVVSFWQTREEKLGRTEQRLSDAQATLTVIEKTKDDETALNNLSNADLADRLR